MRTYFPVTGFLRFFWCKVQHCTNDSVKINKNLKKHVAIDMKGHSHEHITSPPPLFFPSFAYKLGSSAKSTLKVESTNSSKTWRHKRKNSYVCETRKKTHRNRLGGRCCQQKRIQNYGVITPPPQKSDPEQKSTTRWGRRHQKPIRKTVGIFRLGLLPHLFMNLW